MRRTPHSATKQPSANIKTSGWCQNGVVQFSVIGTCLLGRLRANSASLLAGTISPPVCLATNSIRERFGFSDLNSSAAGSELQPAEARPTEAPPASLTVA